MKKKILIICIAFVLIVLIPWGIIETAGSDYYNYKGFVTNISENDKGEMLLTTISGENESTFTIKWYTRKKFSENKTDKTVSVGDAIMLTTTQYSNENIKKLYISSGYSIEGKIVFIEGLEGPFILTKDDETLVTRLLSVVHQGELGEKLSNGDTVKIYYQHPTQILSVISEIIVPIEEGNVDSLTEEELLLISSYGYTVDNTK